MSEAIDSALAQTYPNVEIICVDDGSTDDTARIVGRYGQKVQFLRTPNRGACAARNSALQRAAGRFVQFLDADNWLAPDKLERQLPLLVSGQADLVFCDRDLLYPDGRVRRLGPRPQPEGMDPFHYAIRHNCPGAHTSIDTDVALHRVDLLRRVGGFREGVTRAQDKDLVLRLTAAGARLAYVPAPLTRYRQHDGPRISTSAAGPGYYARHLAELTTLLLNDPVYLLDHQRQAHLATRLIRNSKTAYRAGAVGDARAGFAAARSLTAPGELGEGALYRRLRQALGYENTERLRSWMASSRLGPLARSH